MITAGITPFGEYSLLNYDCMNQYMPFFSEFRHKLINHENLFYSFYDTSENPPKKTNIYQFPYLPVMLNYEYYF